MNYSFHLMFLKNIKLPFYVSDGRDPELIFLTDGASKGVMQMLSALIRNENDGVRKLDAICSYDSFG
jgi:hypothetical protein